ncbi:MAG: hypothetical protein F6K55_42185 [Moorea sp. SIO4A3]|nr:hypothetical protein [Moorena sp. SIO4A3]
MARLRPLATLRERRSPLAGLRPSPLAGLRPSPLAGLRPSRSTLITLAKRPRYANNLDHLGQKATLREQPSTFNLQPSTFNLDHLGQKATLREQP